MWQGRFYSYPLDEPHLCADLRYVELNPVRAQMVEAAEAWKWSSAAAAYAHPPSRRCLQKNGECPVCPQIPKNPNPGNHLPRGQERHPGGSAANGKTLTPNLHQLPDRGLQPLRNAEDGYSTQWRESGAAVFGRSMSLSTTVRIVSITIKSAESMAAIGSAGIHLVVQGTNRTNGT